jgi:hypothetical protein
MGRLVSFGRPDTDRRGQHKEKIEETGGKYSNITVEGYIL